MRSVDPGDAPVVGALVSDLFFWSRIDGALRSRGYAVWSAPDAAGVEAQVQARPPALMLIDLGIRGVDWAGVVTELHAAHPELPIVAFGPHRELDTRAKALDAGCAEVVANSKFVADLPHIVDRWLGRRRPDGADGLPLDG